MSAQPCTVAIASASNYKAAFNCALAYRVVLDPADASQEPEGAGTHHDKESRNREPRKAGRSRFLLVAITLTGVVTALAASEAFESPFRP